MSGYKYLACLPADGLRAHGGAAIMIRSDVSFDSVRLDTNIQAVAVRLRTPISLTVCNIYMPDGHWTEQNLSDLWSQLESPILLVGDFNAHHPLWDKQCIRSDAQGRRLEDFIDREGLIVLNTGDPTRFEASTGTMSAIDLAIASPTVATQLAWSVLDDLYQSDHFPILLSIEIPQSETTHPQRWLTDRADWEKFSQHFVCPPLMEDIDQDVQSFTDAIISAAEASIPQRHPSRYYRRQLPWWSAECTEVNEAKKRALRTFRRFPTEENRIIFRRLRAVERRTFLSAQRSHFRDFTATITSATPTRQVWNKIKAVSGKYSCPRSPILLQDGE